MRLLLEYKMKTMKHQVHEKQDIYNPKCEYCRENSKIEGALLL